MPVNISVPRVSPENQIIEYTRMNNLLIVTPTCLCPLFITILRIRQKTVLGDSGILYVRSNVDCVHFKVKILPLSQ